uniref:Carboxylesterase type B domain-containing protein n=1 Tax=Ditylenchus dipsaci TaxID=166011 RepID=A0A915ECU7_9BILA
MDIRAEKKGALTNGTARLTASSCLLTAEPDRLLLGACLEFHGLVPDQASPPLGLHLHLSFSPLVTKYARKSWSLDLRVALLWIQDNIHNFGGDASKVTLWGQQSSAAMLGALSLSRHTRDLFSQTIEMSGSVYAESKLLKECLKSIECAAHL